MITRHIDIDGNKWGILLIYDFCVEYDYDSLSAVMQTFGMRERNIRTALKVLSLYNSGLAVSREDIRMTVIFVSKTTSNGEFWSTINHELFHAEQAILDYYGTDWEGEPPAYLAGYLLKRVVEEIAEPCR